MLDHIALFVAHAVHEAGNALGSKEAHEVVFERNKELRRSGVALASGASAQLAVDAARIVALSSDNGETTCGLGLGGQLDVGSAAGHVGGDGHGSGTPGFGDDVGLLLVQLGVQHLVRNLADVQRTAK